MNLINIYIRNSKLILFKLESKIEEIIAKIIELKRYSLLKVRKIFIIKAVECQ